MILNGLNLPKQIVLLTKSDLLANSIKDNLSDTRFFSTYSQSIDFSSKIDLLIIDFDHAKLQNLKKYKIKTAINLINASIFLEDEIKISKPFRLSSLLKIIENSNSSTDIFCIINDHFVYNERLRTLNSEETSVKFTEKENDTFKTILLSPNHLIKKELLLTNLWKYHENSESSTVDTHLYKLKMKLPDKILQLGNNTCQLNIKTLA